MPRAVERGPGPPSGGRRRAPTPSGAPSRGRARAGRALVEPVSSTQRTSANRVPRERPIWHGSPHHGCNHMAVLTKVLIANRGEIAVRVIRACQELGIATVAVYSELDRDALHVRLADEAYALGGQTAAESYLNTDKILEVIERSGADGGAPRLRVLLREHRLRPGHHRATASRSSARRPRRSRSWATRCRSRHRRRGGRRRRRARHDRVPDVGRRGRRVRRGVRLAGRHQGRVRRRRPRHARRRLGRRGRRARSSRRSREALKGFGRGECYVERYLTWPRHIEMQVIGDKHGNCVWVGRARLLGPAPAPEADRGEPGAGVPRRDPPGDGRGRGQGGAGAAATTTPAPSSSCSRTASSTSSR